MGHMTVIISNDAVKVLKSIYDQQRAFNQQGYWPWQKHVKREDVQNDVKITDNERFYMALKELRRNELIISDDYNQTWDVTDDGHRFVDRYWDEK